MRDKKGHRIVPYPDFSLHELCEKNIWMGSLNFASFLETFLYPSINVFLLIPQNSHGQIPCPDHLIWIWLRARPLIIEKRILRKSSIERKS